jgi:hypothetical protein
MKQPAEGTLAGREKIKQNARKLNLISLHSELFFILAVNYSKAAFKQRCECVIKQSYQAPRQIGLFLSGHSPTGKVKELNSLFLAF